MPAASGKGGMYYWKNQVPAYIYEDPPVQNQWYTVLDVDCIRIIRIYCQQTNQEAAAKSVELNIIIDGHTYYHETNLAHGADNWYYTSPIDSFPDVLELSRSDDVTCINGCTDMRGQSCIIKVRLTAVAGTNQDLTCLVEYETYEAV